jgi:hypothetical protein
MRVLQRGIYFLVLGGLVTACSGSGAAPESPLSATPTTDGRTTSPEPFEVAHARFLQCVSDRGWVVDEEVDILGQQVDVIVASEAQQLLLTVDVAECEIESGLFTGEPIPPPTPEYLEAYYDHLVALKACLEAEGYTIPRSPPTVESFVESLGGNWHPYQWVEPDPSSQESIDEWQRVNEACPQDFSG